MNKKNEIIGNEIVRKRILKDALLDHLSHALLLTGPKDIGKFLFVKNLAFQILEKDERVFKNTHPSCVCVDQLWISGENEDLDKLAKYSNFNQIHRKKENKKSDTIGIDDLEDFTGFLFGTSHYDKKILLIRDIERMTIPAANKFLKTLEEPPAKTLFLMTSSNIAQVLPTIISRTRIEKFALSPDVFLQNYLFESFPHFTKGKQEKILNIAGGRSEILKKCLFDENFLEEQILLFEESEMIPTFSEIKKFELAEKWGTLSSEEILLRLRILEQIWRKNLKSHFEGKYIRFLDDLQKVRVYLKKNVNKRLLFENFFLGLQ